MTWKAKSNFQTLRVSNFSVSTTHEEKGAPSLRQHCPLPSVPHPTLGGDFAHVYIDPLSTCPSSSHSPCCGGCLSASPQSSEVCYQRYDGLPSSQSQRRGLSVEVGSGLLGQQWGFLVPAVWKAVGATWTCLSPAESSP